HFVEGLVDHAEPDIFEVLRHHPGFEQPVARILAEGFEAECRALDERLRCANGVNAAEETADPFQYLRVFQFRRAAAAAREHRETEALEDMQRAPVARDRGDDRDLA